MCASYLRKVAECNVSTRAFKNTTFLFLTKDEVVYILFPQTPSKRENFTDIDCNSGVKA